MIYDDHMKITVGMAVIIKTVQSFFIITESNILYSYGIILDSSSSGGWLP